MLVLVPLLITVSSVNADIRPLLRQQGIDHPLNGGETIKYAGHIRQGRNDYEIYTYRRVFRAAVVDHGVNAIILIRNGSKLFGEYRIPMPANCKVRGQKVICRTVDNPDSLDVVQFTASGPPHKILFDGEVEQLQRGDRRTHAGLKK